MRSIVTTHNVDAWGHIQGMPDKSVNAIITDPDYKSRLWMEELYRVCAGNIVMFCAPENPFFKPDEIAYWVKESRTTNVSKHLARFVEWIIIKRQGDTFNPDLDWPNYSGVYYDRLLTKRVHPYEKPASLAFTFRNTVEHRSNTTYKPTHTTDDEWINDHAFYIARTGNLARKPAHCEPAYAADITK